MTHTPNPIRLGFAGTIRGMTDAQRKAFAVSLRTITVSEFRCGKLKGADVQAADIVSRTTAPRIVVHRVRKLAIPIPTRDRGRG